MGEERSGKGKHFLLCIAGCLSVVLGLCGCVHSDNQRQGERGLGEARYLMSTGQYAASENKTLTVLEAFPQTLGDEALFQLGLIYASPKNPTADYERSMAFFERLITQYPDSSRKEEAAAWVFALNTVVKNEKETVELKKKVRLLEQTSDSKEKMLKNLQEELIDRKKEDAQQPEKKLKQLQDDLEERKKEITDYMETVSQLQNRVIELESQLAKFKNIDLTIEQKKRSTAP